MEKSLKKKVIRILFWSLLVYTAISTTIVWIIQLGGASRTKASLVTTQPSASLSEMAFAKQFVREYLFWTHGKEETRRQRLAPFLRADVDDQGGLDIRESRWNSYTISVDVWGVATRDKVVKEITVMAETVLTQVNNPRVQKRVNRYLVVPIQKAGDSYLVAGIPVMIASPSPGHVSPPPKRVERPLASEEASATAKEFVQSFWKAYTTKDAKETSHLFKNRAANKGGVGFFQVREVRNEMVYQGNREDRVIVECDVLFEDVESGCAVMYPYELDLIKENGRWLVTKMEVGGRSA